MRDYSVDPFRIAGSDREYALEIRGEVYACRVTDIHGSTLRFSCFLFVIEKISEEKGPHDRLQLGNAELHFPFEIENGKIEVWYLRELTPDEHAKALLSQVAIPRRIAR